MPYGKHQMHSANGRHTDDCWRNAPGIFRKASDTFLSRFLLSRQVHADIARSFLKSIISLLPLSSRHDVTKVGDFYNGGIWGKSLSFV